MQLICIRFEMHNFLIFLGIVSFSLNKDELGHNLPKMFENTFFAKAPTRFISIRTFIT